MPVGNEKCEFDRKINVTLGSVMRNHKSNEPRGPDVDWGSWSDHDKRALRLILLADELATLAYQEVNWRDVAVLGRAIVALAEAGRIRSVK